MQRVVKRENENIALCSLNKDLKMAKSGSRLIIIIIIIIIKKTMGNTKVRVIVCLV